MPLAFHEEASMGLSRERDVLRSRGRATRATSRCAPLSCTEVLPFHLQTRDEPEPCLGLQSREETAEQGARAQSPTQEEKIGICPEPHFCRPTLSGPMKGHAGEHGPHLLWQNSPTTARLIPELRDTRMQLDLDGNLRCKRFSGSYVLIHGKSFQKPTVQPQAEMF